MKNFLSHNKKKLIALGIVVILIIIVISRQSLSPKKVESAHVARESLSKRINASGETETSMAATKYAQVTANISKIEKQGGAEVKEGDVIITLNAASLKASFDSSYASYTGAQQALNQNYYDILAQEKDVKAKKQVKDNAEEEYRSDRDDENKATFRTAEANYEEALAILNRLKGEKDTINKELGASYSTYVSAWQNYSNTSIKAPTSGILVVEDIKDGQQVLSGEKLFSVVNKESFQFRAEVDESDISFIQLNQYAQIDLDSSRGKLFDGAVKEISAKTKTTDSGATAVDIKIAFNDYAGANVVGLSGEAKIEVSKKENVLTIPIDYLQEDNEGNFVYIINNGKAAKKRIKIGIDSEDKYEVLEGLTEGEEIIKGEDLTEGEKVSL